MSLIPTVFLRSNCCYQLTGHLQAGQITQFLRNLSRKLVIAEIKQFQILEIAYVIPVARHLI